MKKGKPGAPFEDDIISFLSMESISNVTLFNRAQLLEMQYFILECIRVSRRNMHSFTVAYQHEEGIRYGQIEVWSFWSHRIQLWYVGLSLLQCQSLANVCVNVIIIIMLGNPWMLKGNNMLHSKNKFDMVVLANIIDICLYMEFSDSEVGCAAHFPNHLERDWLFVKWFRLQSLLFCQMITSNSKIYWFFSLRAEPHFCHTYSSHFHMWINLSPSPWD